MNLRFARKRNDPQAKPDGGFLFSSSAVCLKSKHNLCPPGRPTIWKKTKRTRRSSPRGRPWTGRCRWICRGSIAGTCSARSSTSCTGRISSRSSRSPGAGGPDRGAAWWSGPRVASPRRAPSRSHGWPRRSRGCCWTASSCRPRSGYSRPAGRTGRP